MDYELEHDGFLSNLFRPFVYTTLCLLVGLQVYSYLWGQQDSLEGDFSDVKHVVMQLTRGLSEVDCLLNTLAKITSLSLSKIKKHRIKNKNVLLLG